MIADELRAVAPVRSDADEAAIKLAALILARVEIANEWLNENGIFADGRGTPQPVLRVLQPGRTARQGCSPSWD
jgi:hypothetical protein